MGRDPNLGIYKFYINDPDVKWPRQGKVSWNNQHWTNSSELIRHPNQTREKWKSV